LAKTIPLNERVKSKTSTTIAESRKNRLIGSFYSSLYLVRESLSIIHTLSLTFFLHTSRMALDTFRQIFQGNPLLQVLRLDLPGLMVVTSITSIFGIASGVAGYASYNSFPTMINRKRMLEQLGGTPGLGSMAILAFCPKITSVDFGLSMTAHTIMRETSEHKINVAGFALDLGVFPIQGENLIMVKTLHPIKPIMAFQAALAKLLLVLAHECGPIFALGMTIQTLIYLEHPLLGAMAVGAGNWLLVIILLVKDQPKTTLIMAEGLAPPESWRPAGRIVALSAIRTKHACMLRWFRMA
jgi:hypothetical protein